MIAFLIMIFIIFVLVNYYLGKKIYNNISYVFVFKKKLYWILFALFSSSYIFSRLIEKYLPYELSAKIVTGTSYWIVFFFYGLLFFLFLDLIAFVDKKVDFLPNFLKYKKDNKAIITVVVIIVIMALGIFGSFQAKNILLREYTVETSKKLKQNYTIALISDIHLSYQIGYNELQKMIDLVNEQNPDYIFIAGDFFDGDWRTFYEEDINSLLKEFKARKATYMVLGNHEEFLNNKNILKPLFGASGIEILSDESILLNDDLLLVGRKDISEDRKRYGDNSRLNLEELLKGANPEVFTILMDHSPLDIYKAADLGVNLQVSGHTHQGQMYPLGIITERYYPFDYGHLIIDNYNLIATSGAGTWGPPVRIGTQSEVVKINIKYKVNKLENRGEYNEVR